MRAVTLKVPVSALHFLSLPSIGGWSQFNHAEWAKRSLDLIELKDTYKSCAEIYNPYWFKSYKDDTSKIKQNSHHPIVVGAYYEDEKCIGLSDEQANIYKKSFYHDWFNSDPNYYSNSNYYFSNDKYFRDHHHFGGEDKGLEYKWYFELRPGDVPKPTEYDGKERYYSAKNWGYGGIKVDKLNRLTFTEAIKQYNRYSLDGKRCAYLMLGHVLHLLQDQGEPDHAALADHAASSKNEQEAFEEFHICEILAAEIVSVSDPALILEIMAGNIGAALAHLTLTWPIFLIALAACKSKINPNEVGYERLIRDVYILSDLKDINKQIEDTGLLYEDTYDDFFKQMSLKSMAARDDIKNKYPDEDRLDYPLGLGPAPILFPQIPGCNPDIDKKDNSQTKPYIDLTNKVVPNIICYGSGFIRRFYEIVNHVPFVEQVVVVKAVPDLKPVSFAKFDPALYLPECQKCQVKYSAKWSHKFGTSNRILNVTSEPLSPDHQAYIFLQFGPNIDPEMSKRIRLETLDLKLIGTSPMNQPATPIKWTEAKDPKLGYYYWGSFQPKNPLGQPYKLTLEIQAKDATAHFDRGSNSGYELDSHPETIAMVNPYDAPSYSFIDYQPGADHNHKIEIGSPIMMDSLENNQTILDATPINLGLSTSSLLGPDFKEKSNPDSGAIFIPDLTLHNANDIDFFHVHFQTHPNDKYTKKGLAKELGGGLYLESFPPTLEILVQETFGGCLSLELYNSQKAKTHVFNNTNTVRLNGSQDIFTNNEFYLKVLNPDYGHQGKLRYGLFIRYLCGGYILKGKFLSKFWEYMDFPRDPHGGILDFGEVIGDPPETIKYYNPHKLISDLKDFLPKIVNELRVEDQIERNIILANKYHELGQIAQGAGLLGDAELLYDESTQIYRQHHMALWEATVLHELHAIYMKQGRIKEADHISQRLEELR